MSILQTTELKKYYGSKPNITKALDGVTLSIEDGEFVAIVGTSGSGKSTLLNMMGGLDTPTSGSIGRRSARYSYNFQSSNDHCKSAWQRVLAISFWNKSCYHIEIPQRH